MQEDFLGEVTVPTEAEVEEGTAAEKKAMRKLMTLNVDAHDDLIPSMPEDSEAGRVVFGLVRGAKDDEAWKQLDNHIEPLKLKQKHDEDHETFITQVEEKAPQHQNAGGQWDEETTLEHICGNLRKCHEIAVRSLKKKIGASDDCLTVEELKEDLKVKHQKLNEDALLEIQEVMVKRLDCLQEGSRVGGCHNCGKFGHKAKIVRRRRKMSPMNSMVMKLRTPRDVTIIVKSWATLQAIVSSWRPRCEWPCLESSFLEEEVSNARED